MFHQRRLDEPVALRTEMVEQHPAQHLDPLGLRRKDVFDEFG